MMNSTFDALLDLPLEDMKSAWLEAWYLSSIVIVITIVLELLSLETVKACYAKDKALYKQAIVANLLNHYVYGPPIYAFSVIACITEYEDPHNYWRIAQQTALMLFIHAVCYYHVHKTFHSSPDYYKYHKFHHRFNTYVTPISANAVGVVEYIFAYIFPCSVAGLIVRPDATTTKAAIAIISLFNLLIHTPFIEDWSQRYVPEWLVSTHDHYEHHRKLNVHYAAPTFNLDYMVEKMNALGGGKENPR
jgi:sterol desaturase/sphingolipid hydroxylase (fatty acid hydroxylase superfamily)